MKQLKCEHHAIFQNWSKNMVGYGLEAGLGQLYGSRSGQSVLYDLGNFLFLAGQVDDGLWADYQAELGLSDKIIISEEIAWQDFLSRQDGLKVFTRYAFSNQAEFDKQLLEEKLERLSSEDQILAIDQDIYEQLGQPAWSRDLQGDFADFDDFDKSGGYGFVIKRQGEIIAAVSTGLVYQEAIEVEIATAPAQQRQGLAVLLGAKMVLESLDRDVFPLWDAHNEASKKIAQQLGYKAIGSYPAYEWIENGEKE